MLSHPERGIYVGGCKKMPGILFYKLGISALRWVFVHGDKFDVGVGFKD